MWTEALRGAGRALLRQPRALAWVAPLAWAGLLWWLSSHRSLIDTERAQALVYWGNLAHAPAFGILALLLLPLAPRAAGWVRLGARELATVFSLATLYAAVDELHQSRVPGRDASLFDVVTDTVGVACVLWIAVYLSRRDGSEGGLRRRLLAGLALCAGAAVLSTTGG